MLKALMIIMIIPFFGFSQSLLEKTSVKDQLEDFEILKTTLLENHSGLYDYTDTLSFNNELKKLNKNLNTPQTILKQLALYKSFIASINCIHTIVYKKGMKRDFAEFKYMLPFSTYFINGKLYASSNFDNGKAEIHKQDRIFEINGQSIDSLIPHLYQFISSDGNNISRKNQVLKNSFLFHYLLYTQSEGTFRLKYIHEKDTLVEEFENCFNTSLSKKRKSKIKKSESISYRIDSANSYSILTLPIPLPNRNSYKKELDDFFTLIISDKVKNLIIDLRDNGGGRSQEYIAGFFTQNDYCMLTRSSNESNKSTYKKHFKHRYSPPYIISRMMGRISTDLTTITKSHSIQFKGELYILINGNTASAASNLASTLKEWSNAIVVGEESGGGYRNCNSGNLVLELPNSKIRVLINNYKAVNTTLNSYENDGVSPHYHILESNYFDSREDLQLNYIIEKISPLITL